MQRRRAQKGCLVVIGAFWSVRYADWIVRDGLMYRKQGLTKRLAPATVDRQVAIELQNEFMAKVNASILREEIREHCESVRLDEFVERTWFPEIRKAIAHSTYIGYRYYWREKLLPVFGILRLVDLTPMQIIEGLNSIMVASSTKRKLQFLLSSIFRFAVCSGLRRDNPCRELR